MTEERSTGDSNLVLAAAGVAMGLLAAAGYGAWRAVSAEGVAAGERWSRFGEAMLFPGVPIVVVIAVIVVLGWKANIDG